MKMSKKGICCDRCFALIARDSTDAAKMWLDLCELYLEAPLFGLILPNDILPSVRLLEILRFITTTDTPEMIIVKVHGYKKDDEQPFFCGGRCND